MILLSDRHVGGPDFRGSRIDTQKSIREKIGEDGSFLLEHVTPQHGKATLEMDYNVPESEEFFPFRYCTIEKPVTVEEGKTTEILFTLLNRTSVIEGQIHVADDDLLPEYIQIQAVFQTAQGEETHTVHARPAGMYRLDLLPAGRLELQAAVFEQSGEQHGSEKVTLELGAGQTLLHDFHISQ